MPVKDKTALNILMLNYEFPPLGGGAANATRYLLEEFTKYPDLKIDLITSSTGKNRVEQYADNIIVHYLDIFKNDKNLHFQTSRDLITYSYKAYFYCLRLKKQQQFDLCHAFFGIPCGYIAMKLGLPYIVSLRGSDVPFYNNRFYWPDRLVFKTLSRKIWSKAEKIIANSEGLKALAQETAPDLQIEVIHNGVDTSKFKPPARKEKSEKLRLVSTGRLIERKGYRFLIEALKDNDQVVLTLIGDGNLAEELKDLAIKNNVHVNFTGMVKHDDLPQHLQEADIFVLPSLNEGMSNSVLEAMACGLPIITTDTGGSKELVRENGFIVSKRSIGQIRNKIYGYYHNKALVEKHSIKSLGLAKEMNWDDIARNYYNIYLYCE